MSDDIVYVPLKEALSVFFFDACYDELDDADRKQIDLIFEEDFGGLVVEKDNSVRMRYIP